MRVLISTYPYGETSDEPLKLLRAEGWDIVQNPHRRRLKAGEVSGLLSDADAVIAGTEPYTEESLAGASRLKVIARVGIGLDNVDLLYCNRRGIQVTYTPDAPSDAVAELTVANILNLARHIHESDRSVREKAWNRLMGALIRDLTIGIIGAGRIGSRVIRLLEPFGANILATDINMAVCGRKLPGVKWCGLDEVLKGSDIITLHIPLIPANARFINRERISIMKTGACLINTSRGGVVDEQALTDALLQKHLGGAALDVFDHEPYSGPLTKLGNVILTAHIGASAQTARRMMELTAAEDCIKILKRQAPVYDAFESDDYRALKA